MQCKYGLDEPSRRRPEVSNLPLKVPAPIPLEPECIYGVCTCSTGYMFDGENCVEENKMAVTSCTAASDCQENQQCRFNRFKQCVMSGGCPGVYIGHFDITMLVAYHFC